MERLGCGASDGLLRENNCWAEANLLFSPAIDLQRRLILE